MTGIIKIFFLQALRRKIQNCPTYCMLPQRKIYTFFAPYKIIGVWLATSVPKSIKLINIENIRVHFSY